MSDKGTTAKPDDQSGGSFLALLNDFKTKSRQDLIAMANSLMKPTSEDATESIPLVVQEESPDEHQTRDDLISMISLIFSQNIDPDNPSLARLEKKLQNLHLDQSTLVKMEKLLHKTSHQQNAIPFEKVAALLADTNEAVKEGAPTVQLEQQAVKEPFASTSLIKQMSESDFDFKRQFDGKEIIFQSFHQNGSVLAAGKSEQEPLPKVSVQQFFSEVIELVKNQVSLKKASEFLEAKFSLTPEQLGDIDVKLSIHKGQVTAHFSAETLLAKETLESQISLLRSSLQQQGLQVDKLEISLGGQGMQQSFSRQDEKPRQDQSQQRLLKKKIQVDEYYQSHSTLEEYKNSGNENTINILA